ncbi:MAG: T9SS type A sorting domain-containing protein [Dysgonamonadaceae bacterium]|nr:T9SS type A sorting domain-containing protein [Dysgonamonadaceae bacterium]
MELTGNYSGESGSAIFLSASTDRANFMHVSGMAAGTTEILPDVFDDWDGSPVELIKAQKGQSNANTFFVREKQAECNRYATFLGHGNETGNMFWYLYGTPVLPLIVQLAGHTLLVNNNSATNGGYCFVHYAWYKDGELLKEGTHANNGGSYYTGGAELDENADYTVKVTGDKGNIYFSCPYRYTPVSMPVNVFVYPNPVPLNTKASIQVGTNDVSLLDNATVEIYDVSGQYIGKININGQSLASLDLPAKAGIYLLKFGAKDYVKTLKIMVE